ncbi:MAG: EH signature domain-containing protein [Bacteroidales bacterium]
MNPSHTNSLKLAGFHFSFDALKNAADELISADMHQELAEQKEILDTIIDQHVEREMQPDRNIRIAFLKFKAAYRNGDLEESLSDRTLMRRLSYCPAFYYDGYPLIIEDEGETQALLTHLDKNWKDSYIIGLFSSMIQSWECENRNAFNYLRTFILQKISEYKGNRHSILRLQQHLRFYEKDSGAFELGQELFSNGIGPLLAPEYLGLPRRWLEYEYFSQILSVYFEKGEENRETRYHQIFRILEIHPSKTTAKRILSKMILELHQDPDDSLREEVKRLAFSRIGDPAFEAFWMPPTTFTEQEKAETEEARIILNGWITAQFISVFFEVCITDERRKAFWLDYSKTITHFRVIGTSGMLQVLRQDHRVANFLETRFQVLGGRSASKSAIMMRMNKYTLIEFSDTGFAFYAYRHDNPHCPSLNAVYTGLEELRDASMPIISISDGILLDETTDEGRLRHANQWEAPFRQFLEKHVLGTFVN